MQEFVTVRVYMSRPEADVAASFLKSRGIPAIILSDDAGGMYPASMSPHRVELQVPRSRLKKAQSLLE
jgi:hypothetical protein